MPAFTTALLFSIGPSVAKALLAAMLSDYPVIKDIAPDLLEMLRDKAKDERGKREAGALMGTLGEHVAAQIRPLFAEARLDDTARVAVLRELLITLQQANAEQMIASRVDARRLRDTLLAHRTDATKALNAAETALYQRAIEVAAQALVPLASELYGFESLRDATLLQGLDDSAARDAHLLTLFTALLGQPEAASAHFEQRYRAAIRERLDKLELIGVRRLNTARQRQRLNVAYVTVEVDHRRARGDGTDAALRQALTEAGRARAHASDEALQASPIDDVLATERRIVVRGDPGSGKTTLLQWVAVKAAAEAFAVPLSLWNNLVPFFIRLREIGVKTAEFPRPEEYIARIEPDLAGSCPTSDWAHIQLEHGRAVLLIDGVDEIPASKRGEFLERLQDLVRLYPLARYIITSRPAAVSAANWPEWHAWVQEAGFAEVVIKDMSPTAINSFIDHWHRAYDRASDDPNERAELPIAAAHLKQRLDAQAGMRRLAANPLLCSMICALHLERRNTLPSERIELYRECIDMLMEQRDAGSDISLVDYPQLNTTQRHELLQDLAFRMMRNSELELDDETVLTEFTHFLPRLGLEQIAPARLLNYFVARTGLLRAPAEGVIDFPHRSFQEYFTAKAIADTAEVGFLLSKAGDESWRETIALAAGAGMLPQKQREDMLRGLLYGKQRRPKPDAPPLAATTPPGHRALALACLETAGNIDPALRQEVFAGAEALFPPYSHEQQRLVAAAGDHAIPYLVAEHQPNIAASKACIATLARIGGDQALAAIESYLPSAHEVIESAIDAAWPSFDYRRFARRLLSQRTRIAVCDAALLPVLAELPQLTTLDLSATSVSDLTPLAQLPTLTQLDLSGTKVSDLSVLKTLPNLAQLDM